MTIDTIIEVLQKKYIESKLDEILSTEIKDEYLIEMYTELKNIETKLMEAFNRLSSEK